MEETTTHAVPVSPLSVRCAFCFDAMTQDVATRFWANVTGYAVAFCCDDHRKTGIENPRACRVTGQTRLIGCVVPQTAA